MFIFLFNLSRIFTVQAAVYYARWNKGVGYCQGLNVLAALLLEVMGRSEIESLKVTFTNSILFSVYVYYCHYTIR